MSDGTQNGKLADVALQVASGELAGIEVAGFTVWESRIGPNVTFPTRKFAGRDGKERVLVRRSVKRADATGMSRLRVMILKANSQAALEADRQANPAHGAEPSNDTA